MKSGRHCWHRHQTEMNRLDACSVSKVLVFQKQLQGRQAQTCLTLTLTPQESRLLNPVQPRSSSDSALKHNGPENIWSFGIAENLGEQIMARMGKHFSFSMVGQTCCQVLQIVECTHFFILLEQTAVALEVTLNYCDWICWRQGFYFLTLYLQPHLELTCTSEHHRVVLNF